MPGDPQALPPGAVCLSTTAKKPRELSQDFEERWAQLQQVLRERLVMDAYELRTYLEGALWRWEGGGRCSVGPGGCWCPRRRNPS